MDAKSIASATVEPMFDDAGCVDSEDVARILGVSVRTVEGWRSQGLGPPWLVVTPRCVRYQRARLLEWIRRRHQGGSPDDAAEARSALAASPRS